MKLLKNFFEKHKHYLSPVALIAGFIWDNLTLQRVDLWVDNIIILIYLFISGASIILLNAFYNGKLRSRIFDKFSNIAPLILQFTFGGLFSVFVVFYSKSASLITSWPFLVFLFVLLVGNEVFQKKYLRLVFQTSIFFIALFSYSIFSIPVVLGKMGAGVFLLSGFISLIFISLFIFVLFHLAPERIKERRHLLFYTIGGIYLFFNVLYFTNTIPPIPLSLKEGGVYYDVKHVGARYEVKYDSPPWYLFFKDYNPKFYWVPGERVYVFSAVFAPTKLNTNILHCWSYFNEEKGEWIVLDNLRYSIFGGRDGGYRGFSFKSNVFPGNWKVDIITERSQLLGRIEFEVIQSASPPRLKIDLK